ncbi:MAG: DUF952 domain-containing protein [Anaerolineae bacterium]|nr:DUF952 domain-containing protein [Anaerolineae bacterium]
MSIILHITTRDAWQAAQVAGAYRGDTLDTAGFIHCSTPAQVVPVADAYYRGQAGLVLLCIEEARVQAEIRYESPAPGADTRYPHVYGPMNLDAVVKVVDFPPNSDGTFALPAEVADLP